MRIHILPPAVLAAAFSVGSVVTATGQQLALPKSLASAPAYEVIDRLLSRRTEFALTDAQVAQLATLSADLRTREEFWQRLRALSSKPWIVPAGRPSPQEALDRAVKTLAPPQRERAVRALASNAGSSQ